MGLDFLESCANGETIRVSSKAPSGIRSQSLLNLLKTVGDIVRIQPNHLSFNSLRALEDIYGYSSKVNKAEFYRNLGLAQDTVDVFTETYVYR